MSRLTGIFITLMHLLGASIIGYYSYALRIAFEAQDKVNYLVFLTENPMIVTGLFASFVAIAIHATTITVARAMDRAHVRKEHDLEHELEHRRNQMNWVEDVIRDAVRNPVTKEQKEARKQLLLEKDESN